METPNSKQLGQLAENTASTFLQAKGLILLESNYQSPFGEIDLILKDQRVIIFVEVRSRSNISHGHPLETITRGKQLKIIKTATCYLLEKKLFNKVNCRFDVIAIDTNLEWIKNAFSLEYC